MIKIDAGWIRNFETGEKKDIIIKSKAITNQKDKIIGGCIIAAGVIFLNRVAFKNGVNAFQENQDRVFKELGLFKDGIDCDRIGTFVEN